MIRDTIFASGIGFTLLCICDYPRRKIAAGLAGFLLAFVALTVNRLF